MLAVFCSPNRYTQGKNATAVLGAEMAGLGLSGPALIVGGRSPIRLLTETWKRTFAEAGIAYAVHEFGGECSLAEIERIKQAAKQNKSQVVVGAGGGKVLDAARAAAADLNLPVANCPTVASSDAPCSALSVIYSDEGVVQGSRFYRKNPDLVLVDTQVIAMSPPRLLMAGRATHPYLHGEKVAFGLLAQLVMEGQPRSLQDRVLSFTTEVGLPITLADIGLTELSKEQLKQIAVRATAENETIHNEPFEVLPEMVADAIMAADATGRAWKKDHRPNNQ